jgi:hypothetical protein
MHRPQDRVRTAAAHGYSYSYRASRDSRTDAFPPAPPHPARARSRDPARRGPSRSPPRRPLSPHPPPRRATTPPPRWSRPDPPPPPPRPLPPPPAAASRPFPAAKPAPIAARPAAGGGDGNKGGGSGGGGGGGGGGGWHTGTLRYASGLAKMGYANVAPDRDPAHRVRFYLDGPGNAGALALSELQVYYTS